jgi:hypothetical protein
MKLFFHTLKTALVFVDRLFVDSSAKYCAESGSCSEHIFGGIMARWGGQLRTAPFTYLLQGRG